VIPNGLPLQVFEPVDPNVARCALKVSTQGPVILAAAQDWTERRKGGAYLKEALLGWKGPPITLLTLGNGTLSGLGENVIVQPLGFIDHDRTKVLAYSAADLFAHPAPTDNLPNVVMEALACGTPVVGFEVGGVPDMVRSGESGWLATTLDSGALRQTLETALRDIATGTRLRRSCRKLAEREYSDALQAKRYLALFEQLILKHANAAG
jgi:glycosyltransferase involved in cell wall biosynthesis